MSTTSIGIGDFCRKAFGLFREIYLRVTVLGRNVLKNCYLRVILKASINGRKAVDIYRPENVNYVWGMG